MDKHSFFEESVSDDVVVQRMKDVEDLEGRSIFDKEKVQKDLKSARKILSEMKDDDKKEKASRLFIEARKEFLDGLGLLQGFEGGATHQGLTSSLYQKITPIIQKPFLNRLTKSFGFENVEVDAIRDGFVVLAKYKEFGVELQFDNDQKIQVIEIPGVAKINLSKPFSVEYFSRMFHTLTRVLEQIEQSPVLSKKVFFPVTFKNRNVARFRFDFKENGKTVSYVATAFDLLKVIKEPDPKIMEKIILLKKKLAKLEKEHRRKTKSKLNELTSRMKKLQLLYVRVLETSEGLKVEEDLCDGSRWIDFWHVFYDRKGEKILERTYARDKSMLVGDVKYSKGKKIHTIYDTDFEYSLQKSEEQFIEGDTFVKAKVYSHGELYFVGDYKRLVKEFYEKGKLSYGLNFGKNWPSNIVEKPFGYFSIDSAGVKRETFSFVVARERNPSLTEAEYFEQFRLCINTKEHFYRFEELFSEHLKKYPSDLLMEIRKYGKEICGITSTIEALKKKYGVDVETDVYPSERFYTEADRFSLKSIENSLSILDVRMRRYPKTFIKASGLKKIYIFDNFRESKYKFSVGGVALGEGEIGFSDINASFDHELLHCADDTDGGYRNGNPEWGKGAHGPGYEKMYGKSGYIALRSGKVYGPRPKGFGNLYGKLGGIDEDQAVVGKMLTKSAETYGHIMGWVKNEPALMKKVERKKAFYYRLSRGCMDAKFWKDLANGKLDEDPEGYWKENMEGAVGNLKFEMKEFGWP